MQKLVKDYLNELSKRQKKRRKIGVAVTLLVVLVIGSVVGVLMQYGVAMTGDAKCGIEEHTHTEECYTDELVCGQEEGEGHIHTDECYEMIQELICGQEEGEEHAHTEECYQEVQGELICGQEESEGHTHTEDCYEEQLTCGKEEHVHTDACYIDRNADVEDASMWDAQYADAEWKGAWGEDLVTAAKAQIGYKESSDNYVGADDGSHKGYTRYGQFAGDAYTDWDAAFVNFCMHYAGLEVLNLFPKVTDTADWYNEFQNGSSQNSDYLAAPQGYEPKAGDIIFMVRENEERDSQMGVVSSYNKETNEIKVIEGNSENEVKENKYRADDRYITAYLKLTEVEESYKNDGREKKDSKEVIEPETKGSDNGGDEENWAYEESYDADKVIIHVKAKEGVVPKGAELSVTPIEQKEVTDDMTEAEAAETEKVNEQYELTNQKLEEESKKKDEKLEGFLAYDICFIVDEEEVEPSGEVKVTMDFKEATAPEGISENATVSVEHLKEIENEGIHVENLTEADTTSIQTTENEPSVEKIELITDQFSIFTISWWWEALNMSFGQLNIKYLDENEKELIQSEGATNVTKTLNFEMGKQYDLKEELGWETITTATGDVYEPIRMQIVKEGKTLEVLKIEFDSETSRWNFLSSSGDRVANFNPMELSECFLQVIHQRLEMAELEIISNIKTTGNLDVKPTGNALERYKEADECNKDDDKGNDQKIRYIWYKSVNGGEYKPVQDPGFEDGTFKLSGDYGCSLNVVLDEGALNEDRKKVEYKVELYIGGSDIPVGVSAPKSIPFYGELQNGSFEDPVLDATETWADKPQEDVKGWKTTACNPKSNNSHDIEIAKIYKPAVYENDVYIGLADKYTIASLYQDQNDEFTTVDDGYQFAELNAETVGSLYQDVLASKGRPLNYHLAHRARCTDGLSTTQDTMYLVIVPTFVAENGLNENGNEIDTQQEVEELIRRKDERKENGDLRFPGVYTQKYVAVTQKWTEHDGVYTPQYDLNRFFFVSAQSRSTMGNFLDDVWFSQKLPEPKEDSYNFGIEKTIEGLNVSSVEELKRKIANLKFKITVPQMNQSSVLGYLPETLNASDMTWTKSGDEYIGIKYYYDIPLKQSSGYEILVEETDANIEPYGLVTTVTPISSGVLGAVVQASSGKVQVANGSRERLAFKNVYGERDDSVWQVVKRSSSKKNEKLEGAKFSLVKENKIAPTVTGTSNNEGIVVWESTSDVSELEGTYILAETEAPDKYFKSGETWQLVFHAGKLDVEKTRTENQGKKDIEVKTEGDVHSIYINNDLIYSLPSTGGSGIYWYMFSGMLLMAGAALITYKKRCREVLKG